MLARIIHIVKRFGPVGGMETYVWRLVHGLSERGCSVSVICEQVLGEVTPEIEILQVEMSPDKPRWKSMLVFRQRVDMLLQERFKGERIIVHSHERSISHQVTTFHGPPIDGSRSLNWIEKISPRIRGWKQMEQHELLSPLVQCVLSVSSKVQETLLASYSGLTEKRLWLAWPGVDVDSGERVVLHDPRACVSPRFLFIGREWKRKGLDKAVSVLNKFNQEEGSSATLTVFGPEISTLPSYIRNNPRVLIKGWSNRIDWSRFDLLIHPARNEPFGMVISEARAWGLPVLTSTGVGAIDLEFDSLVALDLGRSDCFWVKEVKKLLSFSAIYSQQKWLWSDLVSLHLNKIYPNINHMVFD